MQAESGGANNIARLADRRRRRIGNGGASPSGGDLLTLDPKYPDKTAAEFVAARYVDNQGRRLLWRHRGVFYRYDGTAYRDIEEARLEAEIYEFVRPALTPVSKRGGGGGEKFPADRHKVRDIMHALGALVLLPAEIAPPVWLGESPTDIAADDVLSCRNTLLHLPTMSRLPHTPDYFTLNALDFDYEPNATCPRWLRFLDEVADADTIEQLHRMFGYLLTNDTRQQKAFLLLGQKRSGKGTAGRILVSLVGERNTVSPALSSLTTTFGREQLLGKRLALISDARLSSRTDQGPIIETILSITGEDQVTVQRKFLPAVSGRLPLRFVMLSNELPAFIDISGAFVSRWIILPFPNSFYGKEDERLTDALLAERPGILNWALAGLARLREAGCFAQPAAAADLLQRWEDLSSPIGAFLRSECVVDPAAEVGCDELFGAWKEWCAEQGMARPGTKATFGRSLIANVVSLKHARAERKYDVAGRPLKRPWLYRGIRLKSAAEREAQE